MERCGAGLLKDNKASTLVAIRDLFCKRRRAMLQYGTPDWARYCLARLPLAGAFVLAQLVLKRVGADHLQALAQPFHAVFCSGAPGRGWVFFAVNLVLLPAERSTSDEAELGNVAHNYPPFDMLIRAFEE